MLSTLARVLKTDKSGAIKAMLKEKTPLLQPLTPTN